MQFFGTIAMGVGAAAEVAAIASAFGHPPATPIPFGQGLLLLCVGMITYRAGAK